MAITTGSYSNSLNKATTANFNFTHSVDTNTKCLAIVITGFDTNPADSIINSVQWDSLGINESLQQISAGRYFYTSSFVSIWYKASPTVLSTKRLAVSMSGTCTDIQATAINLLDSSASYITYDSQASGSATTTVAPLIASATTGSIVVGGGVVYGGSPQGDPSLFSIASPSREVPGSETDMGNQVGSVGWSYEITGSARIRWNYSAGTPGTVNAQIATFKSVVQSNTDDFFYFF